MEVNVDPGTYYSWVHGFGYYTPTSTKNVCTGGAKAVFTSEPPVLTFFYFLFHFKFKFYFFLPQHSTYSN